MNIKEYEKMASFERKYWWHQGRLHLMDELINAYAPKKDMYTILEVGCGTGENMSHLKKYGKVTGIDFSKEAIGFCKQRGVENVYLEDINNIQNEKLLKMKGRFDIIFALDVLEHIQDDVGAMSKIREYLGPDGVFITAVPAHKFLWSEHDESLHHKRRYHSLELKRKLADAGFIVVKKSYFIFTFFPIIVLYRFWGNIFGKSAYPKTSYVILPDFINYLFYRLLKFEATLIKYFDLPVGVTIVAVAKSSP